MPHDDRVSSRDDDRHKRRSHDDHHKSRKHRRHHSDSEDSSSDEERDHKRKSESHRRKHKHHKKRRRHHSDSSDDSNDNSSESESDDNRRRRHKHKHKKHKRQPEDEADSIASAATQPSESTDNVAVSQSIMPPSQQNFTIDDLVPDQRQRDAQGIVARLLELHPEGLEELRTLFEAIDATSSEDSGGEPIELEDLEDKCVKTLLVFLLSETSWAPFVYCIRPERSGFVRRRSAAASSGVQLPQVSLVSLYDEICLQMLGNMRSSGASSSSGGLMSREQMAQHKSQSRSSELQRSQEQAARQRMDEYNKAHGRSKSLLELHQQEKAQKLQEQQQRQREGKLTKDEQLEQKMRAAGYVTFDREKDMAMEKTSLTRTKEILSSASALSSKFDSRMQTSFLQCFVVVVIGNRQRISQDGDFYIEHI